MRLHRYDIIFRYVPGSALVIADTLSRACPELDETQQFVAQINDDFPTEEIPDEQLLSVIRAMAEDEESQILLGVIQEGWSDNKNTLPNVIKPCFAIRDTVSHDHGVILKGERIFIPRSLRSEIKSHLHSAHFGADSMIRRAKQTIFWLGLPNELRQLAAHCETSQSFKPK